MAEDRAGRHPVGRTKGQSEASHALGMSKAQGTMRRVVLPQAAMRVIIPPTGNEYINMLKTSLARLQSAQYNELLKRAAPTSPPARWRSSK